MRKILPNPDGKPSSFGAPLLAEHGPLMGGGALWRALGYRTGGAFRKACALDSTPVKTFTLEARKGRFAWTKDVVAWLDALAASTAAAGEEGGADHE